ncbi:MAG: FAD-binding oxidoreductase [bacterium]
MSKKHAFTPPWRQSAPAPRTFRSIFKWGDPHEFKHPNRKLFELMKQEFRLTDDDFALRRKEGDEEVALENRPPAIEAAHVDAFEKIVGRENISLQDYERVRYSYGKTMEEALELRDGVVKEIADVVLHPRDKQEVAAVVEHCHRHSIPITVFGAGSSVNFGVRPTCGGVVLVLQTHMNRIVRISELNKSCTVQAGMLGPAYEEALNEAPQRFGTKRAYTCGHFPQSFEYSTVGGWIVTWGAGQQSSYFGDACDLVLSQEYITPQGNFVTYDFPATATGPKLNDIMKGSEGAYGILVEATMKIFYHFPKNTFRFAYMFPDWERGVAAVRTISQGEFGFPGVMRLSDPEETQVGLKLYGVEGTILDTAIKMLRLKPGQRCLFLARTEGERGFSRNVLRKAGRICRRFGGVPLSGYAVRSWEHGRYRDPYLREDMEDFGIVIDTLETSVTWENLQQVHQAVRKVVKARPNTICMTHASHFYPHGTNLYFILNGLFKDRHEYVDFQTRVIDAIASSGGSLSHHHGVGKMLAPWMREHLGSVQMGALQALKHYFDPQNIMNPGGQLGLDAPEEVSQTRNWRINWKQVRSR